MKNTLPISRIDFYFVTVFTTCTIFAYNISPHFCIVFGLHYLLIKLAYNSEFLSKFADMK